MPPLYEGRGRCAIEFYNVEHTPFDSGAFGSVYRGKCLRTQRTVAIKMLLKEKIDNDQLKSRVRSEINIHSKLKHPSIVELYESFEDDVYVYLVMEYCSNGNLNNFLKKYYKNGMPESEAASYLYQITKGLSFLHSEDIIHRDFSAANVLLTKDNQCKIGDFGLSAVNGPGACHKTMCGTPNYIAPEIAANYGKQSESTYGAPADVWSLGILIYFMLVGKAPFETPYVPKTLNKIKRGEFEIPSHISDKSKDLILKILRPNAKDRISLKDVLIHPFFENFNKEPYYVGHNVLISRTMSADGDSGLGNTISSCGKSPRYRSQSEDRSSMGTRLYSPHGHHQTTTTTTSDPSINPIITRNNSTNNYHYKNNSSNNMILSGIPLSNQSRTSIRSSHHSRHDNHHNNHSIHNSNHQRWNDNVGSSSTSSNIIQKIYIPTSQPPRPSPLNSKRLLPTRHRTRNAILTILKNGEVCIEFIKNSQKHLDRINEVCRISNDGFHIEIYKPTCGDIGDEPPPTIPAVQYSKFTLDTLPQKQFKKYNYADKFIKLVKAKTPKLTMYKDTAKILYMENGPDPDIEVHFYDGVKVTRIDSVFKVIQNGIPYVEGNWPSNFNKYYEDFHIFNNLCIALEKNLEKLETDMNCSYFPVTIGRRPQLPSILSDSTNYRGKENISGLTNISQPFVPSFSGSCSSSMSVNSTRSVMRSVDSTNYPIYIRKKDIPGIGRIGYNPNGGGDIVIEFSDGITATKSSLVSGGAISLENTKTKEFHRFSHNEKPPDNLSFAMRDKFNRLPEIIERYMPQNYVFR